LCFAAADLVAADVSYVGRVVFRTSIGSVEVFEGTTRICAVRKFEPALVKLPVGEHVFIARDADGLSATYKEVITADETCYVELTKKGVISKDDPLSLQQFEKHETTADDEGLTPAMRTAVWSMEKKVLDEFSIDTGLVVFIEGSSAVRDGREAIYSDWTPTSLHKERSFVDRCGVTHTLRFTTYFKGSVHSNRLGGGSFKGRVRIELSVDSNAISDEFDMAPDPVLSGNITHFIVSSKIKLWKFEIASDVVKVRQDVGTEERALLASGKHPLYLNKD